MYRAGIVFFGICMILGGVACSNDGGEAQGGGRDAGLTVDSGRVDGSTLDGAIAADARNADVVDGSVAADSAGEADVVDGAMETDAGSEAGAADGATAIDGATVCASGPVTPEYDDAGVACGTAQQFPCGLPDANADVNCYLYLKDCAALCASAWTDCHLADCPGDGGQPNLTVPVTLVCVTARNGICP